MKAPRKSRPVAFGSRDWFQKIGETSLAIGSVNFHRALIELLGCLIKHDASWIIRFSDVAPPEVMYTHDVPQYLVDHYYNACSAVDPFAAHWKLHKEVGVRTLSRFRGSLGSIDAGPYSSAFKPAANVSDELGLFLLTIGNASIGLFLERSQGDFTEIEIDCAITSFSVFNNLEKAHIGKVFEKMRRGDSPLRSAHLSDQPVLVQDRYGIEIFSSPSWKSAVKRQPSLLAATQMTERQAPIIHGGFIVSVAQLDKYFPLAPGGLMFSLEPCPSTDHGRVVAVRQVELKQLLTRREREFFELTILGRSTSDISRIMNISKESIKNLALRIYNKSKIHNKREFFQYYASRK